MNESSPAEQYQNEILRPILKAQNELILGVFGHYLQKRKINFEKMNADARLEFIQNAFRKDQVLRNFFVGLVVGQLSAEQWPAYAALDDELNRRVVNMLIKRVQSQLGEAAS